MVGKLSENSSQSSSLRSAMSLSSVRRLDHEQTRSMSRKRFFP